MKAAISKFLMCIPVLLLAGGGFFVARSQAAEEFFSELKGDHFIIYYRAEDSFAREVLRTAEGYYQSIAKNLGYDRFDKFWTWENRVKIYLFSCREEYLLNTRAVEWSEGFANYEKKLIVGYKEAPGFMDHILPHEIAHLIFRDFVGMKKDIPIWLDEGVALSQEVSKRKELFDLVRAAVQKNALIPLEKMVQVRSESSLNSQYVGLFYAEATVTIHFLLETYRRDKFIDFCKGLRDGYGVNESLRRAYRTDGIENLQELQEKLIEFVGKTAQEK